MRPPREDSAKISLFPFLSILVCLIGTLALALAASMLSVFDPSEVAEVEEHRNRIEQLEELNGKNKIAKAKIQNMEAMFQEQTALQDSLRDEVRELSESIDESQAKQKENADQQAKVDELKKLDAVLLNQILDIAESEAAYLRTIESMRKRLNDLGVQIKDIDERRTQLAKQQPGDNISILTGGSGRGRKPVFVECTVTSVIIRPSGKRLSVGGNAPGFLDYLNPSSKSSFGKHLNEIKQKPGTSLVFLIRPGATAMFKRALAEAEKAGVHAGYLPLPSQAPVKIDPERNNP